MDLALALRSSVQKRLRSFTRRLRIELADEFQYTSYVLGIIMQYTLVGVYPIESRNWGLVRRLAMAAESTITWFAMARAI